MDACRIVVRGDEMINSFLHLIIFVVAIWCLAIVIKAIVDNMEIVMNVHSLDVERRWSIMGVYITGDCHGDFRKFSTDSFPEQKGLSRDDFVIVCGDFGLWHDTKDERYWLNWLQSKPFTLLFVDGNHENFDRLYSDEFPIIDFHGGKVHKIRENVYHLMRGHVFELCGKKFFAFGGASSHDIQDGILEPDEYPDKKSLYRDFNKRTQRLMIIATRLILLLHIVARNRLHQCSLADSMKRIP